jgi:hypothetical protein
MSKLRVDSFSISIDGYGAGPGQDLQNPLGVRGLKVFDWFFRRAETVGNGAEAGGILLFERVSAVGGIVVLTVGALQVDLKIHPLSVGGIQTFVRATVAIELVTGDLRLPPRSSFAAVSEIASAAPLIALEAATRSSVCAGSDLPWFRFIHFQSATVDLFTIQLGDRVLSPLQRWTFRQSQNLSSVRCRGLQQHSLIPPYRPLQTAPASQNSWFEKQGFQHKFSLTWIYSTASHCNRH